MVCSSLLPGNVEEIYKQLGLDYFQSRDKIFTDTRAVCCHTIFCLCSFFLISYLYSPFLSWKLPGLVPAVLSWRNSPSFRTLLVCTLVSSRSWWIWGDRWRCAEVRGQREEPRWERPSIYREESSTLSTSALKTRSSRWGTHTDALFSSRPPGKFNEDLMTYEMKSRSERQNRKLPLMFHFSPNERQQNSKCFTKFDRSYNLVLKKGSGGHLWLLDWFLAAS